VAQPTTTSYAILCLLAVRDWTAYELAQQMDRSVGNMWPRAASVVYEEPKRLVALGFASATATSTGKRASTTYGITAKGRRALHRWLEQPGAGPVTEFEGLLKVAFADHGSVEGLRANLRAIRALAEAEASDAARRFEEYTGTGGPHPDRLPIIALAAEHFRLQSDALLRWVDWAETATREWSGVTLETGATVPTDAFRPNPGRPTTGATSDAPAARSQRART
jgi:PadR family transcriptional regulator, regulatory protein AphA